MEVRPEPESAAAPHRGPLEWKREDLSSPGRRSSLEWIETDGLGGFACGCAEGATRRYHGWYSPPSARTRESRRLPPLVAGCEEYVWCAGETLALREEPDAQGPDAPPLARFALDPFPTWRYETGAFSVERSLCLVRGRPIAIARYANRGERSVGLRARPLIRAEKGRAGSAAKVNGESSWLSELPGAGRLFLRGTGARALHDPRAAAVPWEGNGENLWSPVAWDWVLSPGEMAYLVFSPEEVPTDPAQLLRAEQERRQAFSRTEDEVFDELARRAEIFLVDGDARDGSIVAGFPEPAPSQADDMLSVPGLTLACAHYAGAARVVGAAAARLAAALAPPGEAGERGRADLGSSDAPLWLVLAVDWFTGARRNPSRPTPLLGSVRSVLSSYRAGLISGVSVGPDGLISGEALGQPLTWMNAISEDGDPVTPRYGRAVEVNALWHAALKAAARLERLAGESTRARELEAEAWHVARRFNEIFWCPEGEFLYDVVGPDGSDSSLRPNQILAAALSPDLLPPHRAKAVYWAVRSRLLTPFGLRTLDPRDPRYRPRPEPRSGGPGLFLHQGASWPWLLGAFADAHFRVLGNSSQTRRSMLEWLEDLRGHVREAGLGSISQVFDGDAPHTPRGHFADARAVAEISRILYTYLRN
ncbi:MAG TPA: amylo-alpha-1,6-glucosidase [Thermoanaerobaculia bacterium]|nr:amylo-alpha-1,6-glucosidase [Thermoanaerobaculia bacterium]